MIKNIIIAVLSILLFAALFVARVNQMRADKMTTVAQQAIAEAEHARTLTLEALKEASFQREQAAEKVTFLEAQLQKSGRAPYKEK